LLDVNDVQTEPAVTNRVDGAAVVLGVHVRRIYELIKILEILSLVTFTGDKRGRFSWKGTVDFLMTLGAIQNDAVVKYPDLAVANGLQLGPPLSTLVAPGVGVAGSQGGEFISESPLTMSPNSTPGHHAPASPDYPYNFGTAGTIGGGTSSTTDLLHGHGHGHGSASSVHSHSRSEEDSGRVTKGSQSGASSVLNTTQFTQRPSGTELDVMDFGEGFMGLKDVVQGSELDTFDPYLSAKAFDPPTTAAAAGSSAPLPPPAAAVGLTTANSNSLSAATHATLPVDGTFPLLLQQQQQFQQLQQQQTPLPSSSAGSVGESSAAPKYSKKRPVLKKSGKTTTPAGGNNNEEQQQFMVEGICKSFLQIFLLGMDSLSMNFAIQKLIPMAENQTLSEYNKMNATKIRRVYDVANVLCSLNLISKVTKKASAENDISPVAVGAKAANGEGIGGTSGKLPKPESSKSDSKVLEWTSFHHTVIREYYLTKIAR